jgi:two-component system nitrogen regulation sensor histidine kinase GlnL
MMAIPALTGLDLLGTAILLVDQDNNVHYANPSAENLFEASSKTLVGHDIAAIFQDEVLDAAIEYARANHCSYTENDLRIGAFGRPRLLLSCTANPVELDGWVQGGRADALVADGERASAPAPASGRSGNVSQGLLLEFRHIEQQMKIAREERLLDQSQANRELIRNLAHEIKNPLGGIRGAAQLLERELERPDLHEYTQVIMKEADRLQLLMDRLLTPHRLPQPAPLNIHEVLERVRSVIVAEYPQGITVVRDYDTSLPHLTGDREQLIQAVLNVVRNAAQAMHGKGRITLRTRIARQATLARRRYKQAIQVQIIDNGPGIPEAIRDKVFYPLVSGREGGSGLGLTLVQNFVTQHQGTVEFDTRPEGTTFTLLLPIMDSTTH